MIGTLTSDYDEALKLKKRIEDLKIIRYIKTTDSIRGYQEIIYIYSDDENKERHKNDMILRGGWNEVDSQKSISLYSNLHSGESVRFPCGIYSRKLKFNQVDKIKDL